VSPSHHGYDGRGCGVSAENLSPELDLREVAMKRCIFRKVWLTKEPVSTPILAATSRRSCILSARCVRRSHDAAQTLARAKLERQGLGMDFSTRSVYNTLRSEEGGFWSAQEETPVQGYLAVASTFLRPPPPARAPLCPIVL